MPLSHGMFGWKFYVASLKLLFGPNFVSVLSDFRFAVFVFVCFCFLITLLVARISGQSLFEKVLSTLS